MAFDVSVIIPVYQRQELAVSALRSVLEQKGVTFEVIVVDDGSPDPFVLPADLADNDRIRLLRQPNAGAAAARNTGVRATSADWIAFLDSDDLWLPGKLAGQLAFARDGLLKGWPHLTAVMCGFTQIDLPSGSRRHRIPVESWNAAELAAGCWFGPGSTALIPRNAFEQAGLFDETLMRLEDLDWFMRVGLLGGGVATWPELAVTVRVGGRPSVKMLDDAVGRMRAKWLEGGRVDGDTRRNLAAYLALEQASARRHAGRWLGFLGCMTRSLLLRPRLRVPLRRWWTEDPAAAPQ
ncbi:glycosyltransferase family 2 protein [Bosea sp. 2YAB26]|uniref:glycosyltransferase family 2 protein n=1 Tax=Bosea sp. 2YAB26 TaxID=3237478 RepID=UPI003F90BF77